MPTPPALAPVPAPPGYAEFLERFARRIAAAQLRAAAGINAETILLYYESGRAIRAEQDAKGWGAGVIARLSADLRARFPGARGYSLRNLRYMRDFADAWPDAAVVDEILTRLPWAHNLMLFAEVDAPEDRLWYARAAIREGWTRAALHAQIASGQHRHQGRALTNFTATLPAPRATLAQAFFRDHYVLEVSGLRGRVRERELEAALVARLRSFFLAFGSGFAFLGSQYRLEVAGEEFFLDLLFYHVGLGAYVVLDLKRGRFRPEYAGKMAFYLTAVDEGLPNEAGKPAIGIILCTARTTTIVEYTLRNITRPIGVATYATTTALPAAVRDALPPPDALRAEVDAVLRERASRRTRVAT